MIIFGLDGVLADIEHRRHFVDPRKHPDFYWGKDKDGNDLYARDSQSNYCDAIGNPFKPDWQAFNEACSEDNPIKPVVKIADSFFLNNTPYEIWTGRGESVRQKTEDWLNKHDIQWTGLKMRPPGDNRPAHVIKEEWLKDLWPRLKPCTKENKDIVYNRPDIKMVFESDPESIAMYRKRGIFVFDCRQT